MITLYTLNLHNSICQLYLNKVGGEITGPKEMCNSEHPVSINTQLPPHIAPSLISSLTLPPTALPLMLLPPGARAP